VYPSGWHLHHYTLETDEHTIFSIMRNQFGARDWFLETKGLILVPLRDPKSKQVFLKHQFAGNCAQILDVFLNKLASN
jgi:hypothetical protein